MFARIRRLVLALARPQGTGPARTPWTAHQEPGDALLRSGRYEEAVAAYQRGVQSHPAGTGAFVNMGHALCHLGRWEEAAAAYTLARRLDPGVAGVCANLGDALLRCGHWEEAVAAYRRAIHERPEAVACHVNLGHALLRLNRHAEALSAYQRALEIAPGLAEVQRALDVARSQAGRPEADPGPGTPSDGGIDVAVTPVSPGTPVPPVAEDRRPPAGAGSEAWAEHHARGDSLVQAGRWEEAVAAYQLATECRPAATASYVSLGHMLCHLGRWEAAMTAYTRARELDPGVPGVCANLGDVLMRLDRWDEATDCYRTAMEERPEDASPHVNLGHALWRLRRMDEAATAYQAALRLDPDLPEVRRPVAFALSAAGRLEEAVDAYQHAIACEPEPEPAGPIPVRDATELSALHRSLGDVLLKLERWDEAAAAQRRADELNPPWSRSALDPVAQVELWIARGWRELGALPPPGPRLMFVLDSDYGELTTVMLLLFGQEMSARASLLLSPRLYVNNRDVLPGRTHPFTSVDDVMRAVDRERPDVVFLCSGYLFSIHELLSLEALERLVRLLREQGCHVVTTDPFLGLLPGLGSSTTVSVDIPANASPELRREKYKQDARLLAEFSASHRILMDVPHLYPTYPAPLGQETAADARVLSFYNEALLCPMVEGSAQRLKPTPRRAAEGVAQKPRWLFILATRDYVAQVMFCGKEPFVDIVIRKIQETLAAGRHPVFVAPHDLIQSIIAKMPPTPGVTLLTFCPFRTFLTLLLDAEFAFYWNVVSHSMLLRLMNQRPFFMFDRGHLVRNVTPLEERVVDWYYQGRAPIMLRQERGLDLDELEALARDAASAVGQVARGLSRAPTPEAMVGGILSGAGANGLERRERPTPSLA
jgi:tetratricopeptide (TPR) repeat protein